MLLILRNIETEDQKHIFDVLPETIRELEAYLCCFIRDHPNSWYLNENANNMYI